MKKVIRGVMVPLGHNKFVLSNMIVAVEPVPTGVYSNIDQNGNKLRSRVLINHAESEIMASRTAETILKSMTREVENKPIVPLGISHDTPHLIKSLKGSEKAEMSEKDQVIHSLIHCATTAAAIEFSPFSRSTFYRLLKKYDIDKEAYLAATDDPEAYHDQVDDGLV